ncbi:hypothetical protein [Streptomyces sp. BRA346]|uniref:hypothetical protein n=1 Tax=Streptomyces sp. BRA346 TaxID=2878199 RepID=UPI00406437C5
MIVLVRQFRPQKVTEDARRWWVVPVVLGYLAPREPGLIDHDHRVAAAALLPAGFGRGRGRPLRTGG